ncbi:MAG: hypothetical protein E7472_07750 [Ruminococcaceae bacterium]|nr:hypothetical protein [Oscillospiraceae bacterium]
MSIKRRIILPALMISLLLSGCGGAGNAERKVEQQRDAFAAAETVSFRARCTAYPGGDEVFVCELSCSADAEQTAVVVDAPATVAGISAVARSGETVLSYDGVQLVVGSAAHTLGPIPAMPLLAETLCRGHVLRAWEEQQEETQLIAADFFCEAENTEITVWFEESAMQPMYAELRCGGATALKCEILNFTCT